MQHEYPYPHRPPRWAVAGLLIIGLLVIGSAIQSSAWSQGYTMGLLTGSADSTQLAPYLLYRTGPGSFMGGGLFGSFFGGVFRLGFLLLLALGAFKLISFAHWQKHGGPPPWWRHHGPCSTGPSEPGQGPEGDTPQAGKEASQPPAPVNG